MADVLHNNKIIIIPRKKSFVFYYDTNNSVRYIPRGQLEICRKLGIEIEGKPAIINGRNCYSIDEDSLKELVEKSEYIGIEKKVQLEKVKKQEKEEKIVIAYQDAHTKEIFLPIKYLGVEEGTRVVMDKPCVAVSEQDLEKMTNQKIIIVTVYLKQNNSLKITTCSIEDRMFIPEEIADTFEIELIFRKRIRVDGEVFVEATLEDLTSIQDKLSQDGISVEFSKKEIVPIKKQEEEKTYAK